MIIFVFAYVRADGRMNLYVGVYDASFSDAKNDSARLSAFSCVYVDVLCRKIARKI